MVIYKNNYKKLTMYVLNLAQIFFISKISFFDVVALVNW